MQTPLEEPYSVHVGPVRGEDSDGEREEVVETHRAQLLGHRLCRALAEQRDPDPDPDLPPVDFTD